MVEEIKEEKVKDYGNIISFDKVNKKVEQFLRRELTSKEGSLLFSLCCATKISDISTLKRMKEITEEIIKERAKEITLRLEGQSESLKEMVGNE